MDTALRIDIAAACCSRSSKKGREDQKLVIDDGSAPFSSSLLGYFL
jgi:hypothetical protein